MESRMYCKHCGHLLAADARFCPRCGNAVTATATSEAPTQYLGELPVFPAKQEDEESTQPVRTVVDDTASPPPPPPPPTPAPHFVQQPASAPTPVSFSDDLVDYTPTQTPTVISPPSGRKTRRPKRKRNGCLMGCLGIVAVIAVIVGGVYAWLHFFPAWSDNIAVGKQINVDKLTVSADGDTVMVDNSKSDLDGMTIEVPEGAYEKKTRFTISEKPIEGHDFGADFNPITPLIHVDNGGQHAAEPLLVTVPIEIEADEFAMAFYYDPVEGKLEGIPLVDLTNNSITIATTHFSWFTISSIKRSVLEAITVDTGFKPGVDDWQFVNRGSVIAPKGHCAGQSISAMWYYYEQKLGKNEPALWGRFDNNDLPDTPAFWYDDSWGYRFASVVQENLVDWDHISRTFFKAMGRTSDYLSWASFVYSMHLTEEPQYVAIYSDSGGHAIVAYKVELGRIYVADPNYPGKTDRYLRFENDSFQPYSSGADATDIEANGETKYTSIRYFSKSAMTNWEAIGQEYKKMLKGKVGDGDFFAYDLYYLSDIDDNHHAVWTKLPEILELTEDDTAKPGEDYRGKLIIRVDLPNGEDYQTRIYKNAERVTGTAKGDSTNSYMQYDLKPGVHDLGILTQGKINGDIEYNDFYRFTVLYEADDLSGKWVGVWRVEDAEKVIRLLVEMFARVVYQMGFTETYEEAEAALWAGVEESNTLYDDRPIEMVFTLVNPDKHDKYDVVVTTWDDDGIQTAYQADAIYREGEITIKWRPDAGTTMRMEGLYGGDDILYGDYTINAWGIIKDAVTGSWEIQRKN